MFNFDKKEKRKVKNKKFHRGILVTKKGTVIQYYSINKQNHVIPLNFTLQTFSPVSVSTYYPTPFHYHKKP
jgi:hypothetical protein